MWLRSRIALAGGYSSDSTLSQGTSICHRCGPKKTKEKKKKKEKKNTIKKKEKKSIPNPLILYERLVRFTHLGPLEILSQWKLYICLIRHDIVYQANQNIIIIYFPRR